MLAAIIQLLYSRLTVVIVLHVLIALMASGHAVLSKRDTRAAAGWVGVICLAPFVGAVLYMWLGINRITKRAKSLRSNRPHPGVSTGLCQCPIDLLDQKLTQKGLHLKHLINLVRDVTSQPLLAGNRIIPLINGDEAYPAMLEAIDEASQSITLTTYIFRNDEIGQRFLEALQRRQALLRQADLIAEVANRTIPASQDRDGIEAAQERLAQITKKETRP